MEVIVLSSVFRKADENYCGRRKETDEVWYYAYPTNQTQREGKGVPP
jgi:hypothetical protein